MTGKGRTAWGRRLVEKVTCPSCWHAFEPEDSAFISKHPELLGDPVAGPGEYLRFAPVRFTPEGDALDSNGAASRDIACPRCRLDLPELLLEVPPFFISVVGAPASGKSYLITTMAWMLRRLLPQASVSFSDADPASNSTIHEYEQSLFMSGTPDRPTEIRKTQRDDPRLYRTALIDGTTIRFPVPLQFLMWPGPEHPGYQWAHRIGRVVVLYDNAGEDYLPHAQEFGAPTADHLGRSNVVMVLFDPTQDPNFRARCTSDDPQLTRGLRPGATEPAFLQRQETVLREAIVRIRRQRNIPEGRRVTRPLIIVVPKFDILSGVAGISIDDEPYVVADGQPLRMDMAKVEEVSFRLRKLFLELCPGIVAAAEGFSEMVVYIPVSSFGGSPECVTSGASEFYGIRPRDVRPRWVTVPLIYCFCRWARGLIGVAGAPSDDDLESAAMSGVPERP